MSAIKSIASAFGFSFIMSCPCIMAQLPSVNFEPVNRIARTFGIGYSDGYHECKPAKEMSNGSNVCLDCNLYSTPSMPSQVGIHGHSQHAWNSYYGGQVTSGSPTYSAPVLPYSVVQPIPVPQPQTAPTPTPATKPPVIYSQPSPESIPQSFVPLDQSRNKGAVPSPSDLPPRIVPPSSTLPELIPPPTQSEQLEGNESEELRFEEDKEPEKMPTDDEDLLLPDEARRIYRERAYRSATQQIHRSINRYAR